MNTAEGRNLPVPHCIKGTDGWELDGEVKKALEGKRFTKVEKLTFGSVDLPGMIKSFAGDESFTIELVGFAPISVL